MVGTYVMYQDEVFIVLDKPAESLIVIGRPAESKKKLQVKVSSVQPTNYRPAVEVVHNGTCYLVTGKGLIISLTTGNAMKWAENNGNRIAILIKAKLPE